MRSRRRDGSPLRILFLDNAPFIGGAQVNFRHLLQRLDRARFAPELVIPQGSSEVAAHYGDLGIPLHAISMPALTGAGVRSLRNALVSARALSALTKQRGIDLLFASAYRTGFLAALNRVLTGVPFVWRLCDTNPQRNALFVWLARHVTCVSDAVRRGYPPLVARRFEVVYSGVVAEDLDEEGHQQRRLELRRELGVAADRPVVGCVAHFNRWKGPDVAYRAMAALGRSVPDALLVHVGRPIPGYEAYAEELAALGEGLSRDGRLRALGYRPNAYRLYPLFDVVVHTPTHEFGDPRNTEAFGHPIGEAMGSGIPVVASRVGGIPELVTDGVTGILVPPDDPATTAAAIASLLRDPDRRAAMGREAKRAWRARFTQEREVRDYERIFAAAAGA